MAVITISRQMGSLGDEVAAAVAQRLGYRVVARDLIYQAAQRAGAPEMALAEIDELGLLGVTPSRQTRRAYQAAVRQVMEELAAAGDVVIVGRASSRVLAAYPGSLHVRVVASKATRVQRVAAAAGVTTEAALAQVEQSDRTRRAYLRRHYKVDWDAADLYDVVVNTGRLQVDAAAALICAALRLMAAAQPEASAAAPASPNGR
jgi:cytidylate kinase